MTAGTLRPFIPVFQQEDPRECVQLDGVVYLRTGHCCHCGACCKDGDPVTDTPHTPCSYLQKDGQGAFTCAGRTSAIYLNGCNVWPEHPSQIADKPDCTYRFEVVTP